MENDNLDLRSIVAHREDIEHRKQLFGIVSSLYYTPTESKLKFKSMYFEPKYFNDLHELFEKEDHYLISRANSGVHFSEFANGNVLIESCYSTDQQFAAIRMRRFASLQYNPVTDVRYATAETAQAICRIFGLK